MTSIRNAHFIALIAMLMACVFDTTAQIEVSIDSSQIIKVRINEGSASANLSVGRFYLEKHRIA